jgi:hypothetical protein
MWMLNRACVFSSRAVLASALLPLLSAGLALAAEDDSAASIPDFSSNNVAWIAINSDFVPVPGSPKPVVFDPKHPFRRNDEPGPATYRVADLDNPNLKPWVKAELKKYNDRVLAGDIGSTPRWSCLPGGVPGFSIFVVEPVFVVQGPKEVLLIYSGNHEVRHVYLNVPHSKNSKPSWYGESVGHYENGELVVDTVGFLDKHEFDFVDNWRTPHTKDMHVIERFKIIDGEKTLQATVTVDDPGTFNKPWSGTVRWQKRDQPMLESVCAENNVAFEQFFNLMEYPMPEAKRGDF